MSQSPPPSEAHPWVESAPRVRPGFRGPSSELLPAWKAVGAASAARALSMASSVLGHPLSGPAAATLDLAVILYLGSLFKESMATRNRLIEELAHFDQGDENTTRDTSMTTTSMSLPSTANETEDKYSVGHVPGQWEREWDSVDGSTQVTR